MNTPLRIRYYLDGSILQTEAPMYDDVKEEIAPKVWVSCPRKGAGETVIPREPTPEELAQAQSYPPELAPAKGPSKSELAAREKVTPGRSRRGGDA